MPAAIETCLEELKTIRPSSVVESYKNGIYKKKHFYGCGFPSIRMFNIQNGKVTADGAPLLEVTLDELETYGLKPGDILVNRVNSRELVGKAGLVRPDLGQCTFESKNIRVRIQRALGDPGFVVIALNSNAVRKQIQSLLKPAIGQATINQGDLDSLAIPFPPLSEQRRIVEYLDGVQAQVMELKRLQAESAAELARLSGAVLARAFRGEL
jgi:type I restriction enzyme S subunit